MTNDTARQGAPATAPASLGLQGIVTETLLRAALKALRELHAGLLATAHTFEHMSKEEPVRSVADMLRHQAHAYREAAERVEWEFDSLSHRAEEFGITPAP